ncbi:ATP-binding cassette domain-containing protein [Actinokineospora soli]|uniref:ATP-binding cassette domain-containing protein n=1 Tax=Actinokineospora soli TaxID=1048753 RepID=A0ABW2TQU0_9PSEU
MVGGTTTLGAVVAATTYLTMLVVPVQSSLSLLGTVHEGLAAARRVFAVLDREPPVCPEAGPDTAPGERLTFVGVRSEHLAGPVSFEVGPGDRLVLVAGSGAGKTTVADLAVRFREPSAGRVLLDGRDVRGLPPRTVRRSVVVVEQEPVLRADSVRANLLVGDPDASDEDLTAALLVAAAGDVVEAGLGAPAAALSGGQRQRLAVARAVLARPGVLILDDALTQVDPVTEEAVLRGLDQAFAGGLLVLTRGPCPLPFATADLLRGATAVAS